VKTNFGGFILELGTKTTVRLGPNVVSSTTLCNSELHAEAGTWTVIGLHLSRFHKSVVIATRLIQTYQAIKPDSFIYEFVFQVTQLPSRPV